MKRFRKQSKAQLPLSLFLIIKFVFAYPLSSRNLPKAQDTSGWAMKCSAVRRRHVEIRLLRVSIGDLTNEPSTLRLI